MLKCFFVSSQQRLLTLTINRVALNDLFVSNITFNSVLAEKTALIKMYLIILLVVLIGIYMNNTMYIMPEVL